MGQLIYAGAPITGIPDEQLVYLDTLTRKAFSEGKSFAVIIAGAAADGDINAMSVWLAPQIPVQFLYEGYETIQIDRQEFDASYDSLIATGLHLIGDNGTPPYEFTGERSGSSGE